jgi:hypothetical protein
MTWVRRIACGTILTAAMAAAIGGTATAATTAVSPSPVPSASTQLASPKATATPQPSGSSFPWSNLITAVSTVAAGLGGIWLKDRYDSRRDRRQRRRDVYATFLLNLDELQRVIGAPRTVGELFAGTLEQAIAQATGDIQRAYFTVNLTGSRSVQSSAAKAWAAAWDIHDWLDAPDANQAQTSLDRLEELRGKLREAGGEFIRAARMEIAS